MSRTDRAGARQTWQALVWPQACAAMAILLSACSHVPPNAPPPASPHASPKAEPTAPASASPADHLELQGQLSIKLQAFGEAPAKGLSLGFFFSGNAQSGQLELMTLMGSQMAQVNWSPEGVWLTDDKGRHAYASMDELSAAVLGESLPLHALVHWMQGQPDPRSPSAPGPQPDSFTQLGWTIDQRDMPYRKLTATRAGSPTRRGAFVKVYLDR